MQDLSSPTRDHTHAPTMEAWIPNHRTARVSPNITWFWPVSSQGWSLGGASPCVVCPWAASWSVCKPQTVVFTMISLRWPKCVTLLVKVLRSYRSLWRAIIFWVASRCTGRVKRQRWWQLRATQPRVLPLWVLSYYHACGITWTVINMYIRIE